MFDDDDFHPTRACSACIGIAASILIVAGWAFGEWDSPNGELGLWYSVATCFDDSASFRVGGVDTWDAYKMRPVTGTGLPGDACPIIPTTAPTISITLEKSDGWRAGAAYKPIFLLPGGTYASITYEIRDNSNGIVLPIDTLALGPDGAYPWMAPAADISAAPANSASYVTLIGATCSDSCRYASDNTCDDGGPGAEFESCAIGTDTTDCGCRTGRRLDGTAALDAGQVVTATGVAPALEEGAQAEADVAAAHGARRLLKGGTTSFGGRKSVSTSGRWSQTWIEPDVLR